MFGREKTAPPSQGLPADSALHHAAPSAPTGRTAKPETVIGVNCRMSGVLQSDGGIQIDGMFEGQIQTTGDLIISGTAKVIAEVQAANMVVSGSLKGNVTANRIEITETGKLWGDLNVNSLLLSEGAYLRGQANMGGDVEPPMIEAPRVAPLRPADTPELESANS